MGLREQRGEMERVEGEGEGEGEVLLLVYR